MIPTWNGKRAQQCHHRDRIGGGQNMAGLAMDAVLAGEAGSLHSNRTAAPAELCGPARGRPVCSCFIACKTRGLEDSYCPKDFCKDIKNRRI